MKKILLLLLFVNSIVSYSYSQCPGGVVITEVLIDPNGSTYNFDTDGDGSADTNDEFVKICNPTTGSVDLSGAVLNDPGSGDWFTFPTGSVLAAGSCFTVINQWDGAAPLPAGLFDAAHGTTGIINNGGDVINITLGAESCSINVGGDTDGCVLELASEDDLFCGAPEAYPFDFSVNPLPVELTSFSVSSNNQQVALSWTTATELNNSHFVIEHSIDGTNFRAIDEVAGNGTTQLKQEYSYTHTSPAMGTNYYRLKQVDFDGAFEYSDIRVVEVERAGKIVVNPSAAIAEITVQLADTDGENNLIGIYDMMGRTVLMSNFDGALNTKTIDISNLQKGYYVVRVQAGSEILTKRFMKMVD